MRAAGTTAAALAVGAGLAWWWWVPADHTADRSPGQEPPSRRVSADAPPQRTPADAGTTIPAGSDAASDARGPIEVRPMARSEVGDLRGMLELPDGTFVPTLNGVETAPALVRSWHPPIPWSPIQRVETGPDGVQWYVHADGSRSTTVMAWNPQRGAWTAVTRVGHPTEAPGSLGPAPGTPAGAPTDESSVTGQVDAVRRTRGR